MELFVLDEESGEVNLNKIWIRNNPKLSALFDRDKGNRGVRTDYSAVKKEKAKRDFNLLRVMLNPDSEYSEMSEEERFNESLKLYGYTEKEFYKDEVLQEAYKEYEKIIKSLPFYKAYQAVKNSTERKVQYINDIDFNKVDKVGRVLVTPAEHSKAIAGLDQDLKSMKEFRIKLEVAYRNEQLKLKQSMVLSTLEKTTSKTWVENIEDL